jgi:hypothetical protein
VSGAAWASSSCLTTWAPRRGRGVDFDGWLTWECDSRSRAEHVAFEAIDTCIDQSVAHVTREVFKVILGSYTCRGVEPPEPGGLAHVRVGHLWESVVNSTKCMCNSSQSPTSIVK